MEKQDVQSHDEFKELFFDQVDNVRINVAQNPNAVKFKEYERLLEERLYALGCKYVEEFLKKNPEYEYVGSEDLQHALPYNVSNIELICSLVRDGFKIIVVGEKYG